MLSIITPVFNGEKYIINCLQSVFSQYQEGIEHIVMDGGSSDNTVALAQEFAQDKPYIRIISEKDKGQSDAMNKGIKAASHPFISFLNVDDYYESQALMFVLDVIKNLPEDTFLVGNCRVWNSANEEVMINKPQPFDQVHFSLDYNFPFNPSAYFYHKSLHHKYGFYDEDEHYLMDIDFILRILPYAKIVYVNRIFGNYVQVEGSKTLEDIKAGRNKAKLDDLFKKYSSQLTLWQKSQLAIFKLMGERRGLYMYYLKNPSQLMRNLFKSK
jgi:glycosyltransferase involved in cell wall biosynthesis